MYLGGYIPAESKKCCPFFSPQVHGIAFHRRVAHSEVQPGGVRSRCAREGSAGAQFMDTYQWNQVYFFPRSFWASVPRFLTWTRTWPEMDISHHEDP